LEAIKGGMGGVETTEERGEKEKNEIQIRRTQTK
jgi:hypothetical protein